jgi:hypothetical protein
VQEAARISPARNLLVGTVTDSGEKLIVNGSGLFNSNVGIGASPNASFRLDIYQPLTNTTAYARIKNNRNRNAALQLETNLGNFLLGVGIGTDTNLFQIYDNNAGSNRIAIDGSGNVGIGSTSPFSVANYIYLSLQGTTGSGLKFYNSSTAVAEIGADSGSLALQAQASNPILFLTGGSERMRIKATGVINISGIPTSAAGLVSGDIYSNLGVLTIVP